MSVVVVNGAVAISEDGNLTPLTGGIRAEGFSVIDLHRDGWLWAGYLRDVAGVWWFHGRNAKAVYLGGHPAFRVLDDDYGLSATAVYLEDKLIPGADPDSFEMLDNTPYFARDRFRVYVKGGKRFCHTDQVDPATAVANGAWIADRDHLFHHYSGLSRADDQKDAAETGDGTLFKDWLAQHHPDVGGWWSPGHVPRPRDPAKMYFGDRVIAGADPATYQELTELVGRDAGRVYYNGYVVDGADPDTFVAVNARFGKDAQRVYRREFARTSWPFGHPDDVLVAVRDSDPASFESFGDMGAWARDDNLVYLWGEPKKKLDPASFEFLGETPTNSWARDDRGLYRSNGTLKVAGVDGAKFNKLNDIWGTDETVVFCFLTGAVARAADASSFRVTDDGAEDAQAIYRVKDGAVRRIKK